MTPDAIRRVRAGFDRLADDAAGLADAFYTRLFEREPGLRAYFKTEPTVQGAKLVAMLGHVVDRLDDLDSVLDDVRALGIRHVAYGVKPHHYDIVGAALLDVLEARLEPAFDDRARAAWAEAYNLLAEAMITAAAEVSRSAA
ncbi:MAG TPA: globin domain-containing protein [Beijerinckiaceae bacterium]|nr:globin domain-containing protein [Beijerinckiaceae bacterium]